MKLTMGVEGNLKALKSAYKARVPVSKSRAGKTNSFSGHPESSIKFMSSPLSVLASNFLANNPKAESWSISILNCKSSPRPTMVAVSPFRRMTLILTPGVGAVLVTIFVPVGWKGTLNKTINPTECVFFGKKKKRTKKLLHHFSLETEWIIMLVTDGIGKSLFLFLCFEQLSWVNFLWKLQPSRKGGYFLFLKNGRQTLFPLTMAPSLSLFPYGPGIIIQTYVTEIPPPPLSNLPSPDPVGLKDTVWSSAVKAHSTRTVLSESCMITGFSWMTTWFTYLPRLCIKEVKEMKKKLRGQKQKRTYLLYCSALSSQRNSQRHFSWSSS